MSTAVVIPARIGSRGIPRKNLEHVGGVPLVQRALESACVSIADQVILSSDDEEILALHTTPKDRGAWAHKRQPHLCEDSSPSEEAVLAALDWMSGDTTYDNVILMQCTSPFTNASDINGMVRMLEAGSRCVVSVYREQLYTWTQTAGITHGQNFNYTAPRLTRQASSPTWVENGALYGMKVDDLRRARHRFFHPVELLEMPKARSVDIDTPEDLRIARILARDIGTRCGRCRSTHVVSHEMGRQCAACGEVQGC